MVGLAAADAAAVEAAVGEGTSVAAEAEAARASRDRVIPATSSATRSAAKA